MLSRSMSSSGDIVRERERQKKTHQFETSIMLKSLEYCKKLQKHGHVVVVSLSFLCHKSLKSGDPPLRSWRCKSAGNVGDPSAEKDVERSVGMTKGC